MVWVLTDQRYLAQRMPAALVEWLGEHGIAYRVVCPESGVIDVTASDSGPWGRFGPGDLVVTRSRQALALAVLAGVPGTVRSLPEWPSVARVRDKAQVARTLCRARVPAPPTWLAAGPASLSRLGDECFPLVVKPQVGDNAEGVSVVEDRQDLDELPPVDGLLVAQPYLEASGVDLKVYVVGDRVWAVRRPSPLGGLDLDHAEPAPVSQFLRALALRCRDAFRLDLLGLDVLETADGPFVVDVNEFPNYTGVEGAVSAVGELVASRLGGDRR